MTQTKPMPSRARLLRALRYDVATGDLVWLPRADADERENRRWNAKHAGAIAGSKTKRYVTVRIDGEAYMAHRVAWVMAMGDIPDEMTIDHINGDTQDNRLSNLRLATFAENSRNQRLSCDNRARLKGASFHKATGKWSASIHDGKAIHLGLFDSPELAHAAYVAAARERFGEFARAA